MTATTIATGVAAGIAIEELDRLRALECLPTPEALLKCMQARTNDFHLLVGVCAAYLGVQGVSE